MTTRYVDGTDGNDANDGLAAVAGGGHGPRKTLNGVEDTPVQAGDTVYVRAGTYRETLTCDVSGSAGNVISYIADYAGTCFPSGGVVRITASDDDQSATRVNCIALNAKDYRTFTGFVMDTATGNLVNNTNSDYLTLNQCYLKNSANAYLVNVSSTAMNAAFSNCLFWGGAAGSSVGIVFTHASAVDNAGHSVQNCIFCTPGTAGIQDYRVGGITIQNSLFFDCNQGIRVVAALGAGQTVTVNNCIFCFTSTALQATALGEIAEDWNDIWGANTARNTVNTGANSLAYPPLFDPRWFLQLVNAGAGPNSPKQVVSPWDLASYSKLLNVAGTSPTTTDLRGTGTLGTQREWGVLEYDSTLKVQGGSGGAHILGG